MLDGLTPDQFDMETWTSKCGTVCCAAGWAATLPEFVEKGFRLRDGSPYYDGFWQWNAISKFFDLLPGYSEHLFWGLSYPEENYEPSPEDVASRIRDFVEAHAPNGEIA
jgi:hypothetical protein